MRPERAFRLSTLSRADPVSGSALLRLLVLVEVFARDLLLSHVGEFKDEIYHLVFIDWRTKLSQRIGVVAVIIPDLFLAAWHLAGALDHRAAHLVLRDRDLRLLAYL